MAKKKGRIRTVIKLKSTESPHLYWTSKNKGNAADRLELKKHDPVLKKHVLYREAK